MTFTKVPLYTYRKDYHPTASLALLLEVVRLRHKPTQHNNIHSSRMVQNLEQVPLAVPLKDANQMDSLKWYNNPK